MNRNNERKVVPAQPQGTPIIGQRFLEEDVPGKFRKIPLGVPLPLAGLFAGDKEQLDRIEEKLDKMLGMLCRSVESEPEM